MHADTDLYVDYGEMLYIAINLVVDLDNQFDNNIDLFKEIKSKGQSLESEITYRSRVSHIHTDKYCLFLIEGWSPNSIDFSSAVDVPQLLSIIEPKIVWLHPQVFMNHIWCIYTKGLYLISGKKFDMVSQSTPLYVSDL